MASNLLVVLTNPSEGQEEAYNRWYDEVHVHEVVQVPGFRSAQRFRLAPAQMGEPGDHRYLAIYEIDVPPEDALAALQAAFPQMRMSKAVDMKSVSARMFEPLGETVTRPASAVG